MNSFIVTRNWDATEWSLTELEGADRKKEIWRGEDGASMRRIMTFDAPDWESAFEAFKWAQAQLSRKKIEPHLPWDQLSILVSEEKPYVPVQEKPQARAM